MTHGERSDLLDFGSLVVHASRQVEATGGRMKRELKRRLRHIEHRLDALEHHDPGIDLTGEPLDPIRLARHASADYAHGWNDDDGWNLRGYL